MLSSSSAAVVIDSTTNNWRLDLSALGITLSARDLPQQWLKAPGETGVNVLEILGAGRLGMLSGNDGAANS